MIEEDGPTVGTMENMSAGDVLRVFNATREELDGELAEGLPQNPDGTFRFAAVLAWVEWRVGQLREAKGRRGR